MIATLPAPDPELTEAAIRLWLSMPPTTVKPSTLARGARTRRWVYAQLCLLTRHGFVRRVPGGFVTNQMELIR